MILKHELEKIEPLISFPSAVEKFHRCSQCFSNTGRSCCRGLVISNLVQGQQKQIPNGEILVSLEAV